MARFLGLIAALVVFSGWLKVVGNPHVVETVIGLVLAVIAGIGLPLLMGAWTPLTAMSCLLAVWITASGVFQIIDRVKDVGRIKGGSNGGAMFAPKYVENKLKFFPQIKEVVAYCDQREKVCVMINIDFDAVGNWAERRNLPYAGYTDLAQKPEVYQLIKECVEKVNADLSIDELLAGSQVSRFLVLHKELDADDGELTRTNKVRRGFIAEKYQPLVDALYGGKTEQFIETVVKFEDGRSGSVSATLKISDAKTFAPVKAAA